jgi:hypothetical protein
MGGALAMTLSTLTDDALTAEKRRVEQKIADLKRDLTALEHKRSQLAEEDHRRFCDRVRHMTEGKR